MSDDIEFKFEATLRDPNGTNNEIVIETRILGTDPYIFVDFDTSGDEDTPVVTIQLTANQFDQEALIDILEMVVDGLKQGEEQGLYVEHRSGEAG